MGTLRTEAGEQITFDSILQEQWTYPADITEYPVENNDAAVDHRQSRSRRLVLKAIITDSPFPAQAAAQPLAEDGNLPRSVEGEKFLDRLARSASPITYLSGRMGARGPFWIGNIDFTIDDKRSITFNIQLQEVEFALSETVSLPPEFVPPANSGLTLQSNADGTGDEAEGSTTEVKERSVVRKFANFLQGGENENAIGSEPVQTGSAGVQLFFGGN